MALILVGIIVAALAGRGVQTPGSVSTPSNGLDRA
jgi:hypothetical protein